MIPIKSRFTGEVMKEVDAADLHGADLHGANLHGADLYGADLYGANLRGADLHGAKHILSFGPIGSRGDYLYISVKENKLYYKTGCFYGTEEEFIAQVNKKNEKDVYRSHYEAAIVLIHVLTKDWSTSQWLRKS